MGKKGKGTGSFVSLGGPLACCCCCVCCCPCLCCCWWVVLSLSPWAPSPSRPMLITIAITTPLDRALGRPQGKRRNKTHTLCRRCGRRSYHIQKSTCASCGYPAARIRTCEYVRARWSGMVGEG